MPPDPATPPLPLTPASLPPSSGLRGNEPTRPAQPTAIMQTKAHPTCTQLRLLDMLFPNRELPAYRVFGPLLLSLIAKRHDNAANGG
jgi:hypothetical protein